MIKSSGVYITFSFYVMFPQFELIYLNLFLSEYETMTSFHGVFLYSNKYFTTVYYITSNEEDNIIS